MMKCVSGIGWVICLVGCFEDGKGQEGLVCCSLWGRKESDTIQQVNNKCFEESGNNWILEII